jgi:hypothetical protein
MFVALLGGCSAAGRPARAGEGTHGDAAATAPDELAAPGVSHVWARRWLLRRRLDPARVGSFARLSPVQRAATDRLVRDSVLTAEVNARGGRVLVRLSRHHPLGPVDLLLAEDRDRLFVFVPESRLSFSQPLRRLPDLLDGHVGARCVDFAAEIEPATGGRSGNQLAGGLNVALAYSYLPEANRPRRWSIRHRFNLTFLEAPRPFYSVFQQPLLHVALPTLQSRRGRQLLEGLAFRTGEPLAWISTIENEGRPAGAKPTFHVTVERHGWVRVPVDSLSVTRRRYRPGHTPLPSPRADGLQRIPAPRLAGLRDARQTGELTIANRSAHAALVFVDGAMIGWVAPGRRFAFKGFPTGYYRAYAVSPTGVRYWGPKDLYVPGPWTLR